MQAVAALCPDGVYVPAPHVSHPDDPVTPLYVPGEHATHGPATSGPVYPELHIHDDSASLPSSDDEKLAGHASHAVAALAFCHVPAAHGTHPDDPVTPLYAPAKHAVHVPPSGPVYPALHKHPV